jgi:hypothetical protein
MHALAHLRASVHVSGASAHLLLHLLRLLNLLRKNRPLKRDVALESFQSCSSQRWERTNVKRGEMDLCYGLGFRFRV